MTVEFKDIQLTPLKGKAARAAINAAIKNQTKKEDAQPPIPSKPGLSKSEGSIRLPADSALKNSMKSRKTSRDHGAMCFDNKGRMIVGINMAVSFCSA